MVDFKTVRDVKLAGKRVLLRADYNVPIKEGEIEGDFRLRQSIETLDYILKQKPETLIIVSHLGRPAGKPDSEFSLLPVAKRLTELLGRKVYFIHNCIGEAAQKAVADLPKGAVALMENLRFYAGEEANDHDFAQHLVETTKADLFVQDGFGTAHRTHATYVAVAKLLPSVGGLLLEKEVDAIQKVMSKPDHPLTAIIGGAKISDKIAVLKRFIEIADCVAIVGALANNFLVAKDIRVGKSLIDKDNIDLAEEVIELAEKEAKKRQFKLIIPVDGVVSTKNDGTAPTRVVELQDGALADIEAYPKSPATEKYTVAKDEMILDIGPITTAEIVGAIELSRTVVWSGTCGMTEVKGIAGAESPFAHASRLIAEAMAGKSKNKPFSLAGGGDTTAFIEEIGLADDFGHVSTGGSASLELMAGNKLPGIEALKSK